MKKKIGLKSSTKVAEKSKSKLWILVVLLMLVSGVVGYATHYVVAHWHGFFVTCNDGTRPDKHGCCAGEVYTDAGDGWMVCCPNDSDNCFPPLK